MKKICWFLILIVLLGCFVGCQQTKNGKIENADGTLSYWMRMEIEKAYAKQHNGVKIGNYRYYGTENGYVFIYVKGLFNSVYRIQIGPKIFKSNYNFSLYAYKDGVFIDLKDAYEQGLVSLSAIEKARDIHWEYEDK